MNNKDKIRLIKSSLNAIEELQVRLIATILFMMIISSALCVSILLYKYFIG